MCVCGCAPARALLHWKNISREKPSGNYMTPAVTLRRSILLQSLVVFCIIPTLNTHYFTRQYWPIGLYNGSGLSLLWRRDWIFTHYLYYGFSNCGIRTTTGRSTMFTGHHLVFCLTTGSKPPPKRFLHIVRSRASSFKWEYPLHSLRSSSSFLRLLPGLVREWNKLKNKNYKF
jgi:hypothetical protein